MTTHHLLTASACALVAALAACSPTRGYCAAAAECDAIEAIFPFGMDIVGESNDSVDVCTAQMDGLIRALRANEEEGCFDEAAATEAYFACVGDTFARDEDDACDALVRDADRNPCAAELDDLDDQRGDNGDDCSAGEE